MTIEGRGSKVYQLQISATGVYQNVFWLQIAVDEIGILEGDERFEDLAEILSDIIQW